MPTVVLAEAAHGTAPALQGKNVANPMAMILAGAALLFSTGGLGIKAVDAPPLAVAGCRAEIAAVALAVFLRPRGWRWTPTFAAAVASYALCVTTFVIATKWTTAANAVFFTPLTVSWRVEPSGIGIVALVSASGGASSEPFSFV